MSTTALLTLIAIVTSVDGSSATLEGRLLDHLRPGDEGQVFLEVGTGSELQRIEIGTAEVVSTGEAETEVQIASNRPVRPGFRVRFEVPVERADNQLGIDRKPDDRERAGPGPPSATESPPERLAQALAHSRDLSERVAELEVELSAARETNERLARELDEQLAARRSTAHELARLRAELVEKPKDLIARVRAWAAAWADQDADAFLSFYSRSYRPADGMRRADWEDRRRSRIAAPQFIEITLEGIEVLSLDNEQAEIRFEQSYRSDRFEDRVTKTLRLELEDGAWRISSEQTR